MTMEVSRNDIYHPAYANLSMVLGSFHSRLFG